MIREEAVVIRLFRLSSEIDLANILNPYCIPPPIIKRTIDAAPIPNLRKIPPFTVIPEFYQ